VLPIMARAAATPWQALARIDHPDPAAANEMARDELANGAGGLMLTFAGAIGAHGFGLPPSEHALERALDGIDLASGIALELDLSPQAAAALDAALAQRHVLTAASSNLRLGHDPIGAMAVGGGASQPWRETATLFARRVAAVAVARNGSHGRHVAADGRIVHNAGGSEAQELAFALATGLAYLRALEAEDITLEDARGMIFFRLAADADQFLTIAKFRALRKLWTRVEASCGLSPEPAFVSAETAWRMMTRRDPHVNILRATVAVFAAALGDADAISVLPFTAACGLPDRFAHRVARNTQLVLLEESHLAKVADPAAGSGALEDLTDQLCRAGWRLFQDIEGAGGVVAALESGLIQGKVSAVRARRAAAAAHLRDALTGVSIFPNLREVTVPVLAPMPAAPNAAIEPSFAPLLPIRLAQPFEALREASDQILARTGARPKIFLATLGAPAEFTARASFARNFFEAGGIEAVSHDGDLAGLAARFQASGASLACLCASDQTYESEAAPAAATLKAAGTRHIYLAGRPGKSEASYRHAGVQDFVFAGCDALAVLEAAHGLMRNGRIAS
jgi:methylmalonyl-CoA mutase